MGSPAPSTDTSNNSPAPKSNFTKIQELKARVNNMGSISSPDPITTREAVIELIDILSDQLFPQTQVNQEKSTSEATPTASA